MRIRSKIAEPHRTYFNDALWSVFRQASKLRGLDHDCVFMYQGKPILRITRAFSQACTKAGVAGFHFHDLQHTFTTNMRKAGVDQTVIMNLTGHKTLAMFQRYNTVDREDAV